MYPHMSTRGGKSQALKIRMEPLLLLSLKQIADREQVDVSVVGRRALSDYATRWQSSLNHNSATNAQAQDRRY